MDSVTNRCGLDAREDGAEDTRDDRREMGQSAVLLLVVVTALGIALLAALVDFGGITQERARAQTAADAAALASLDGGRPAAVRLAGQHGATIVSWVRGPGPDEVTVVVGLGATTATARASNAP
jgi:hypothetical protein